MSSLLVKWEMVPRLFLQLRSFTQGQLTQTNEKMDVAIDGGGFFKSKELMGLRHTLEDGALR